MIKNRIYGRKAQSVIEYTFLIAIVSAVFIAMQVYVQRAARANLKVLEEQINAKTP